jgi:hypothetical protein
MFTRSNFLIFAGLSALIAACSSESPATMRMISEPFDAGVFVESGVRDAAADTRVVTSPGEDGTIGKPCRSKSDCELYAPDDKACSNMLSVKGSYSPSPFCIGTCDITDLSQLESCDGNRGICIGATVGKGAGSCRPRCTFTDSGLVDGCIGKNACRYEAVSKTSAGKTFGTGYCVAACRADADCPADEACAFGNCLKKENVIPKIRALGQACQNGGTQECSCLYNGSGPDTGKGYCIDFCVTGESCGAGFFCSARLRGAQDPSYPFSAQANGLAGYCMKTCTIDADCAETFSTCKDFAGGKVCKPRDP